MSLHFPSKAGHDSERSEDDEGAEERGQPRQSKKKKKNKTEPPTTARNELEDLRAAPLYSSYRVPVVAPVGGCAIAGILAQVWGHIKAGIRAFPRLCLRSLVTDVLSTKMMWGSRSSHEPGLKRAPIPTHPKQQLEREPGHRDRRNERQPQPIVDVKRHGSWASGVTFGAVPGPCASIESPVGTGSGCDS